MRRQGERSLIVGIGVLATFASAEAAQASPRGPSSPASMKSWGANSSGQLGIGIGGGPAPVSDGASPLNDYTFSSVAGGRLHGVGLRADGDVWAWGDNGVGQLGRGSTISSSVPVPVLMMTSGAPAPLTGVIAIAAGSFHAIALRADGTVWSWGLNANGQLGAPGLGVGTFSTVAIQMLDCTSAVVPRPPKCEPLTAIAVAAGGRHSIVLRADGRVAAAGANDFGQLGNRPPFSSAVAHEIPALRDVKAIAAGENHNLAVLVDGSVRAWGLNDQGQLGDGGAIVAGDFNKHPRLVTTLQQAVTVAAGARFSMALNGDGSVAAWGANDWGQLGDNTTTTARSTPILVKSSPADATLTAVTAIAAGGRHGLALRDNGSVFAWGANDALQLGGPATTGTLSGFAIQSGLYGPIGCVSCVDIPVVATTIGAGGNSSYALTLEAVTGSPAGSVGGVEWTWGSNDFGQLGDGTLASRPTPLAAATLPPRIQAVAAGYKYSFGLTDGGTIKAHGFGANGQLGYGSAVSSTPAVSVVTSPTDSTPFAGVTAIAAAKDFGLAIRSDGSLWSWGDDNECEIGRGGTGGVFSTPQHAGVTSNPGGIPSEFLENVIAIASGGEHGLALLADGTVWEWGTIGTAVDPGVNCSPAPSAHRVRQVVTNCDPATGNPIGGRPLTNVKAIAAGLSHSLALLSDGTVVAWGINRFGEVGDSLTVGTFSGCPVPVMVLPPGSTKTQPLANVKAIAASAPTQLTGGVTATPQFSMALLADGTVVAWGDNSAGQLGIGTSDAIAHPLPVAVELFVNVPLTGVKAISAGSLHGLAAVAARGVNVVEWGATPHGPSPRAAGPLSALPRFVTAVSAGGGDPFTFVEGQTLKIGTSHSLVVSRDGPFVSLPNP